MIFAVIASIVALTSPSADLIMKAQVSFDHVVSYHVTLRSSGAGDSEEIKYSYKKPGHIRMEFMKPHKGAVLVYNPVTNKVRLRPFDFVKFLVFTIDPDSWLLQSARGHRVNRSDIGSLLKTVRRLQSQGTHEVREDTVMGRRKVVHVSIKGNNGFTVDGINVYHLWLDKQSLLPLRVSAYNNKGEPVEEVFMDDLQINVELPDDFFELLD